MAFVEPLEAFFSTQEFALDVLWNGTTTVHGIFDAGYAEPMGVAESYSPTLTVRAAQTPAIKHGDTLVVSGTTYKVRGVQPDGTGITVLILEKQ